MLTAADFRRAISLSAALLAGVLLPSVLPACSVEQGSWDEQPEPRVVQQPATVNPAGFSDTVFVSGLGDGTQMAFAPDGRLFVSQKSGALRVIKNGTLLTTPFLTVTVNTDNERGLMGVAFDPAFNTNHYVYVYYTSATGPHNRVSRFTANGDVAVAGSEQVLFELPTLVAANHNGGALHFGNDGHLYISVGDNAVGTNAPSLSTPLGKMLRLEPDGSIPTDNPFYTQASGTNRAIWAIGLRNPFTFDVQRSTGKIFINDVGNSGWEEIDQGAAGANYGWPATEGYTTNSAYVTPVYAYAHGGGALQGCAITGGTFYDPTNVTFPSSYVGKYFFSEYCNGWIGLLDPQTAAVSTFATGLGNVVDLRIGPDGAMYYLSRTSGMVGKISYTAGLPPSIVGQPANVTTWVGGSATFSVSVSGDPPLNYQWQRNGVNIAGATAASYTFTNAQLSDSGAQFRAIVNNTLGSATSNAATLTVSSNHPPVATITQPTTGSTYTGGSTLNFAGTGSDSEDGNLPASAFTWNITFHHDTHTHPAMPDTSGITSGSWSIPNAGETSANVWYRVYLTVTDSFGFSNTVYRDVLPVTTNITIATNPAGLQLTLDGQPFTSPYTVTGVAGILRQIAVSSPQAMNGFGYVFNSWSDGGAQSHTITTPLSATTYTASFDQTTLPPCQSVLLTPANATSSSNENGGTPATGAIDGNGGTRWASAFSDPQWIYVDLGAKKWVNRVSIDWENASAKDYRIEISDDAASWNTLITKTAMPAGARTDDLTGLAGAGRFVRMYGTARNTVYGYSIFEFRTYGDNTTACTPGGTGPVCGNGVVESGEQCDDGNTVNTDACSNACRTPTCSDGIQNQGETGLDCGGPCAACGSGGSCGQVALSRVNAVASSVENGGLLASAAIDGSLTTRWASAFSDPQWIYVDLGASRHVGRVVLNWENAASRDYSIEVASDSAGPWSEIYADHAGNGGVDDITGLSATGRFVRMYSRARTTGYGNSLWEFQVYGDNNPNCSGGSQAVCGNGIVESGEQCDDGNTVNTDSCSNTCRTPTCADGIQNQGETGLDCGGPCAACAAVCGNGLLEGSEQCDDGNTVNTDSCSNSCHTPTCADGIQNQGETGLDCGGPCAACGSTPVKLSVTAATSAGAYQTPPAYAWDGNTQTRYTNDGNLATASITFTLSSSAQISRLRLMMYNGASRSYPLVIKVGNTTVFTGSSALVGGFWDFTFPTTTGNTVTITMTSANSAGSNWFSIWETEIYGIP
ncbi:MAG TPA: PQQ-dependent sugar dehydrogenase [Polyangiaceae bacterium]|nr:PQQ-dependent sugar dehydrogenase [Polyangiaceae bacterium]